MSRPEHTGPPELFYNESEATKYTNNTRIIEIQMTMSARAIELLNLPEDQPSFILDVGCGSGLSGEGITEAGHYWVGMDISPSMLEIAVERETDGDVVLADIGEGVPFRAGAFDGVISISVLQWLCNADKVSHNPFKRLKRFFTMLYSSMRSGGRAVFQVYPESPKQMELITEQATRCGFTGGVVVDFPNSTKAKKIFLCLFAGTPVANYKLPQGLGAEGSNTIQYGNDRFTGKKRKRNGDVTRKEWIQNKKQKMRAKGKDVTADSKYTARKRKPKF
ncbi:probable 18S rRNA (guanine-N(7))-methyltransferase [Bolinopsis microptera]|uniref:probable 18S rRNA (guanine-N(7))-methyltransferase n=1 Tax=Bolinopsis microptera TaxID=2820187 RepID=UPI00307A4C2D